MVIPTEFNGLLTRITIEYRRLTPAFWQFREVRVFVGLNTLGSQNGWCAGVDIQYSTRALDPCHEKFTDQFEKFLTINLHLGPIA